MNDLPLIIQLASNALGLLVLLIGLTGLFHFLFIGVIKLNKIAWKRMDYVWLFVASLGLISVAADTRMLIANNWFDTFTQRTQFSLLSIRHALVGDPPRYFCTKFVRSEFSPENFDDLQRQYDAACEWLESAPKVLPERDDPPFKSLNFADTNFPETVTEPIILETVNWIRQLFEEYEDRRKALEELGRQMKRTDGEDVNFVFGPILLCIALALRITKVTGEVRLEQRT